MIPSAFLPTKTALERSTLSPAGIGSPLHPANSVKDIGRIAQSIQKINNSLELMAAGTGYEILRQDKPLSARKSSRWEQALDEFCQQIKALEYLAKEATPDSSLLTKLENRLQKIAQRTSDTEDQAKIQQAQKTLKKLSSPDFYLQRPETPSHDLSPPVKYRSGLFNRLVQILYFQGMTGKSIVGPLDEAISFDSFMGFSQRAASWFESIHHAFSFPTASAETLPHEEMTTLHPMTYFQCISMGNRTTVETPEKSNSVILQTLKKSIHHFRQGLQGQPQSQEKPQCFRLDTLEQNLASSMLEAQEVLQVDEKELKKFGNKHLNLMKMSKVAKTLNLDVNIPVPRGISTDIVRDFLTTHAPQVFTLWEKLASYKDDLNDPEATKLLEKIHQEIERAFTEHTLTLPQELNDWLSKREKNGDYLMVRSTGAEDSKQTANAGGNVSKAYVKSNNKELDKAVGEVVQSYFSKTSLQNRINAGLNPFTEELQMAVTVQELIGEPIDGAIDEKNIPVSFVLFTNEPLYIGEEKFRVMTLSATYGHGEAVVNQQGIATDSVLILRSESQPDQLYYLYDNQLKPTRLAPQQTGQKVELTPMPNSESLMTKPSLNEEALLKIYESGVIMESYFKDGATDIEGLVKNGEVHFVQARPINRKPMLPTYLDKQKTPEAIVGSLQGDTLVPGKASVIEVAKAEDMLVAPTLAIAQDLYKTTHKVVIVNQPEPQNSHPTVNFRGLGVPCLYIADKQAFEALASQMNGKQSLALCMQTGSVNLWDTAKSSLQEHIVEGFSTHPAKMAFSLLGTQTLPKRSAVLPADLKTDLAKLHEVSNKNSVLAALVRIEEHPLMKNFRSFIAQDQGNIPEIAERTQVLSKLDEQITRAFAEIRSTIRHQDEGERLKALIYVKALETLITGSSSTNMIGQYSLLDTESLIQTVSSVQKYQKKLIHSAYCMDLLVSAQTLINAEALSNWEDLLLQIESLVEKGIITSNQLQNFKKFIQILQETKTFPFWANFFQFKLSSKLLILQQSPSRYSNPALLPHFHDSEISLMHTFLKEQRSLELLQSQMDRFASPTTFENAWKDLQQTISKYSDENLEAIEKSSPLIRMTAYRTIQQTVTVLDNAIKTVQSSHEFKDETKRIQLFKTMLMPFHDLMNRLTTTLSSPSTIPTHAKWSLSTYFTHLTQIFENMPMDTPEQLLPSQGFSVSAAMFGAGTDFERHFPKTLGDLHTLFHQTCEGLLSHANQVLLTQKQIETSFLPSILKGAIEQIENQQVVSNVQRIGIEVTHEEIIVRYNVPLNNHSGHIDLHYDINSETLVFKGQFLGPARTRWSEFTQWMQALQHTKLMTLSEPIIQRENEFQFSAIVHPNRLGDIITEYMEMARSTIDGTWKSFLSNLLNRWDHKAEIESVTDYFFKEFYGPAEKLYLNYLNPMTPISGNQSAERHNLLVNLIKNSISRPEDWDNYISLSDDWDLQESRLNIFIKLVENGYAVEEAFLEAQALLNSVNLSIGADARSLFRILIQQGHKISEIVKTAQDLFMNEPFIFHSLDSSLKLFKILVDNGHGRLEAMEIAQKALKKYDFEIRVLGLEILQNFVNTNPGIVFKAAQLAINDKIKLVQSEGFTLIEKLIEGGYEVKAGIKLAQKAFEIENEPNDTQLIIGTKLFKIFIEKGLGIHEALDSAFKAYQSTHASIRSAALQLLAILLDHDYEIEAIKEFIEAISKNTNAEAIIDFEEKLSYTTVLHSLQSKNI